MRVRCPHCHSPIEIVDDSSLSDICCTSCGGSFSLVGDATTTIDRPAEGKTIEHFQLIRRLGVGAFGEVWRANDTQLARTVAIKFPRKALLEDFEAELFLREARAAAQLKHPNIVTVHEVGREGDQFYIVSDFVEGVTLEDRLTTGPLSSREAAELCARVATALHHAHERGVVHRDLKPSNIMLDAKGDPHVMDFGLAKRESGEITMTVEGQLLGTPAYMSPEQAKGSAHDADRRSDVYSLGVILFELLTGERPFRGNKRMLLHQVVHEDPPSPRSLNSYLPRDLNTICLKCLEKVPSRRYPTAAELSEELQRYLSNEPIQARPITALARVSRWYKRNPMVASLCGTVALLLLVLGVGGIIAAVTQTRLAKDKEELAERESSARLDAEEGKRQAEKQARVATAMRLASESNEIMEELPVRSLLLAVEAVEISRRHNEPVVPIAHESLLKATSLVRGVPLLGHKDRIICVDISPDGKWIVTGSTDKTIRLWDLKAKDPSTTSLVMPCGWLVYRVAIGPNSRWVAAAAGPNAWLWDLTAESPRLSAVKLRGDDDHNENFRTLAFSPDGQWLVTGGRTTRLWNLTSDEAASSPIVISGHTEWVRSVAISADSRWLVSGSADNTARIWNLKAADLAASVIVLQGHKKDVVAVAITPDNRRAVTASLDGTVRIWNLDSSDPASSAIVLNQRSWPKSIDISRDGRWLAAGDDSSTKLWDLNASDPSTKPLTLPGQVHLGQSQPGNEEQLVAFSPNGRWLAAVDGVEHSVVKLWDLIAPEFDLTGISAPEQHVFLGKTLLRGQCEAANRQA